MAFKIGTLRLLSTCLLAVLAATIAGCSGMEFWKKQAVDPNLYPANYKSEVLAYLRLNPTDMMNARDAYISIPALKQFGSESRYFVCLRANGQDWRQEKMAVFFSGQINQFVDGTSEQCGAAAYQPFPELVALFSQSKK
jgi:hypothetical protein